jgi:hypothetical protein
VRGAEPSLQPRPAVPPLRSRLDPWSCSAFVRASFLLGNTRDIRDYLGLFATRNQGGSKPFRADLEDRVTCV